MVSLQRDIRRFIERELIGERGDGDPLVDGLLDSLALEQLIAFLEERYDLTFQDEELRADRFSSVPAVARLVRDKQRGGG